ncbi:MAG: DUF4900 domain-containing protein [Candidatus Omnitrophota bacterium]
MKKLLDMPGKGKKGIVLAVTLVVIAAILVATAVYYSSMVNEKSSGEISRYVSQAAYLAEAGLNHGVSEIRERIKGDLQQQVSQIRSSSVFHAYVATGDSLGFLKDFAYPVSGSKFTVSSDQAVLTLTPLTLNSGVQGSYEAVITVRSNRAPEEDTSSGEKYIFYYSYTINSRGYVSAANPAIEKNLAMSGGNFTLSVQRDTFAKFALFTAHHMTPSGTTVWFTSNTRFNGPVHTNERFSFAQSPGASFTQEVTQSQSKARYYNNGWPVLLDASSNAPYDVPSFSSGFSRGQDQINLESSISQADLKNQALGTMQEPGQSGIYVPNNGTSLTGGIYIRGSASVSLGVDSGGRPVYTITQGSTVKQITLDLAASTTTVKSGAGTQTYSGIPDGVDNEGILIYDKGDITGLSGVVQSNSKVTVSSEQDIVITGNVTYESYNTSPVLNAEGYSNVLGILSWGGDVRIAAGAPDNISIHGVVMAPHGVFEVDNYSGGSPRGTATILGGAITDFYGPFGTFSGDRNISGYGRNFVYDARMLSGMTPPYFPYMTNFTSFISGLDTRPVWQEE